MSTLNRNSSGDGDHDDDGDTVSSCHHPQPRAVASVFDYKMRVKDTFGDTSNEWIQFCDIYKSYENKTHTILETLRLIDDLFEDHFEFVVGFNALLPADSQRDVVEDTWVICDACGKWRMLPPGRVDEISTTIPDKWYCKDNTFDKDRSSCDAKERDKWWMTRHYERCARIESCRINAHSTNPAAALCSVKNNGKGEENFYGLNEVIEIDCEAEINDSGHSIENQGSDIVSPQVVTGDPNIFSEAGPVKDDSDSVSTTVANVAVITIGNTEEEKEIASNRGRRSENNPKVVEEESALADEQGHCSKKRKNISDANANNVDGNVVGASSVGFVKHLESSTIYDSSWHRSRKENRKGQKRQKNSNPGVNVTGHQPTPTNEELRQAEDHENNRTLSSAFFAPLMRRAKGRRTKNDETRSKSSDAKGRSSVWSKCQAASTPKYTARQRQGISTLQIAINENKLDTIDASISQSTKEDVNDQDRDEQKAVFTQILRFTSTAASKSNEKNEQAISGRNEDNLAADDGEDNGNEMYVLETSDNSANKDSSDCGIERQEKEPAVADEKEDAASPNGDKEDVEKTDASNEGYGSIEGSDDNSKPEELWDLKMILPASQIRQPTAERCSTAGCDLVACCIWSSNLDPETPWYSCLDCQANDFGGWPEKKEEIPIEVLRDDLREVMIEKCTKYESPEMPNLPSGTDAARGGAPATSEEGATTKEDKSSDDDKNANAGKSASNKNGSSSNDKEDEDEYELWDLKKVFSAKELKKKKPTMCSYRNYNGCDLVACSVWVSNKDPEPWYSCLDCQQEDFDGWPEDEDELPMKFLTEENRQLIAKKCSIEESPAMPNIPTVMQSPLANTSTCGELRQMHSVGSTSLGSDWIKQMGDFAQCNVTKLKQNYESQIELQMKSMEGFQKKNDQLSKELKRQKNLNTEKDRQIMSMKKVDKHMREKVEEQKMTIQSLNIKINNIKGLLEKQNITAGRARASQQVVHQELKNELQRQKDKVHMHKELNIKLKHKIKTTMEEHTVEIETCEKEHSCILSKKTSALEAEITALREENELLRSSL
mmetsp:Transcript_24282/g.51509  ORF Transcript_24282/g.51509 Transcript_24282/m.51509 type:complete len:1060 (+) Transcript_24282:126-3305(+)